MTHSSKIQSTDDDAQLDQLLAGGTLSGDQLGQIESRAMRQLHSKQLCDVEQLEDAATPVGPPPYASNW